MAASENYLIVGRVAESSMKYYHSKHPGEVDTTIRERAWSGSESTAHELAASFNATSKKGNKTIVWRIERTDP